MTEKKTVFNIVLDGSGSMHGCRDDAIKEFNKFLQKLAEETNCLICLSVFRALERSGGVIFDTIYDCVSIKDVKELTSLQYRAEGNTPLLDAIGESIKTVSTNLGNEESSHAIVTVVITDGEENCSQEYTLDSLKELIHKKEAQGNWTFVFLGQGIDNWRDAQKFGLSASGNVRGWEYKTIANTMELVGDSCIAFARSPCMATSAFYQETKKVECELSMTPA